MCLLCTASRKVFTKLKKLKCCPRISSIPRGLNKLQFLDCSESGVSVIPSYLKTLVELDCSKTRVSVIPDTLVSLKTLYCPRTNVTVIPNTLVSLISLDCSGTEVSIIPETLVSLKILGCAMCEISVIPSSITLKHLRMEPGRTIVKKNLPNECTVCGWYFDDSDMRYHTTLGKEPCSKCLTREEAGYVVYDIKTGEHEVLYTEISTGI